MDNIAFFECLSPDCVRSRNQLILNRKPPRKAAAAVTKVTSLLIQFRKECARHCGPFKSFKSRSRLMNLLNRDLHFFRYALGQGCVAELGRHLLAVSDHPIQKIGEDFTLLRIFGLYWN